MEELPIPIAASFAIPVPKRRAYKRARDARVALIRCSECGEYYETSVRQARRIQKGENRRLCETCRTIEAAIAALPDRTPEFVLWWQEESGLSHAELGEIVSMIYPEEVRRSEPVPSPIRRLPSGEANRSNGAGAVIGSIRITHLVSVTSTAA